MSEARPCLIVVVLYRMLANDSTTVQGVVDALRNNGSLRDAYDLLLWDNSPRCAPPIDAQRSAFGVPFRYEQATVNDGVAGALNAALQICTHKGYEWMLLLDQDTIVTSAYLEGMLAYQQAVSDADSVAAIVPRLLDGAFQLSPKQVMRFRDQPVETRAAGILAGEVFAANSGVMLRVSVLEAIGGYSSDFWLDHSDMYVFHQFYLQSRHVFFAADLSLQHSMTMLDYDGSMSPARYENFLYAEQAFLDLYKSSAENAVQILRLCARAVRQRRRYRNPVYSRMTWKFLLQRMGSSKASRLVKWKLRAGERHRTGDTEAAL